ncbi:MAG TPA: zinc ABC transporter substrate-binding protein, partial [Ornithinibacter sp.]|nr:zinc ABC transporter substrate-binding protein [Ornithinibacter sp.]
VTQPANLIVTGADDGHDHAGESADEHAAHAADGVVDLHFWLDPTRMAAVATTVGERFAKADPANAATYTANAAALASDLTTLDEEFAAGLKTCESKELVTGHAAFGYLATRYGLGQEGIAGISPDAEPDAAALRDLVSHVRESGVSTVYAETLVSPALAETIARETGAKVAVLDPLEGLTDASPGSDYLEVMRANLKTLREGQGCS